MVAKVTVLRKYRPEFKRVRTMQTTEAVAHIARRTGLNEGEIGFVVCELRDVILDAAHLGQALKVENLGTFTPTIHLDGRFGLLFRPDPRLLDNLNDLTEFHGKIINKASIGKSAEQLFAQWNQEHPDDPVE
jgi:hypothetical protein